MKLSRSETAPGAQWHLGAGGIYSRLIYAAGSPHVTVELLEFQQVCGVDGVLAR